MQSQINFFERFKCTSYGSHILIEDTEVSNTSIINLALLDRVSNSKNSEVVICYYAASSIDDSMHFEFAWAFTAEEFKFYLTEQLHSYYARLTHVPTLD